MFICRYVTALNTLAGEVDHLDLPDEPRRQLHELLAMCRVLLEVVADYNQLLDEI